MVIICAICNGPLDLPPPAAVNGRILKERCGHLFHAVCLGNHWDEHRLLTIGGAEFKVPCFVCGDVDRDHLPPIFEMFPSIREVTFDAAQNEDDSQAIIALRERFDTASQERDAVVAELQEEEESFGRKTKKIHELQNYRQAMTRQRDDAQKEFHDHIMDSSNNQKLTLEIFPKYGENGCVESEMESNEVINISGDQGTKAQTILDHPIQSTSTRNQNVQSCSGNSSTAQTATNHYNLRKRRKICYKTGNMEFPCC